MTISRRLVLFFPGFEPLDGAAHYRRFVRGAEMTAKVWEQTIELGPLSEGEELPSFEIESGPTKTRFVICDLSPVMTEISSRSTVLRLARGLFALMSFILNGTFFSYVRTSWRYGAFFLYPLLMLGAMIGVSVLVGRIAGTLTGLAEFVFLFVLACRYAHFLLMMDLWHYARVLALGDSSKLQRTTELLQRSQTCVLDDVARDPPEEVILAGHSIGAALAVELADMLGKHKIASPVHLLTLGSGFLQVALSSQSRPLPRYGKKSFEQARALA